MANNIDRQIRGLTSNPELLYRSRGKAKSKELIDALEAKAQKQDELLTDITAEASENNLKIIKNNRFNTI